MFDLCDSGIDFLAAEVVKGDKTTDWLGADYDKLNKVWPYIWRNFDSLVNKKHGNVSKDEMKHTSKMCTVCLKLHNLHVPVNVDDKRKAALEHK